MLATLTPVEAKEYAVKTNAHDLMLDAARRGAKKNEIGVAGAFFPELNLWLVVSRYQRE